MLNSRAWAISHILSSFHQLILTYQKQKKKKITAEYLREGKSFAVASIANCHVDRTTGVSFLIKNSSLQ